MNSIQLDIRAYDIDTKMSKRGLNTSGGNNTLFNYFGRSPSTPKGDKPAADKVPDSPLSSKSKTPTTSKSKTPTTSKLKTPTTSKSGKFNVSSYDSK